jgi:hypothetical protein
MGPTQYGHGRPRSGTRIIWALSYPSSASGSPSRSSSFGLCRVTRQPITVTQLQLATFYRTLHTARLHISIWLSKKKWSIWRFLLDSQPRLRIASLANSIAPHLSKAAQQQPGPSPAFSLKLSPIPPPLTFHKPPSCRVKASSQSNVGAHCSGKKTCMLLGGRTPLALTISILASSVAIGSPTSPRSPSYNLPLGTMLA